MSSSADSEVSSHPALKISGVEQLKPPGSDSNYLDWSWILEIHFAATDVDYIITSKPEEAKLRPTWARDNKAVCGVISRTIHPTNIRNVRHLKTDAKGLWDSLKRAHQDSSAGGVMYWLRKMTVSRMTDDDLPTHLDEMAKTFERLNSLITVDSPLTPEDIYSTCILTSLPQDWLSCVSAMMNEPRVSPTKLIDALRSEYLRRQTRADDATHVESASSTKPTRGRNRSRPTNQPVRHCTYCNMDGHDLNRCGHVARIINSHKSNHQTGTSHPNQPNIKGRAKSDKPVVAGRTSAATFADNLTAEDDESDFCGSEIEAVAGQAAISLSSSTGAVPSGDANLDSGCSMSMTPSLSSIFSAKSNNTPVRLADHSMVEATHKGLMKLPMDSTKPIPTLVVPALAEPLLSIAGLCDADMSVVFTQGSCNIYSSTNFKPTGDIIGKGYRRGNLYYLPSEPVSANSISINTSDFDVDDSLLGYHNRFSHLGLKPLKRLLQLHSITPTINNPIDVQQCQICTQSKMHRRPFKSRSAHRSIAPGQLIHSDVCSYEVPSREGYKYFSSFIDDCSKAISLYPMKSKSDTLSCFKLFRSFFEKDGRHKILTLRTDNGGEYMSNDFEKYLTSSGIIHEAGPPHSPETNGVAERTNRTINNIVRSCLLSAHLPKSFWADAIRHYLFTHNSFPCNTPQGFTTPAAILQVPPVDLKTLHPFGCLAYYKVPEANRKKLDTKARAAILLSYLPNGNGYRLWDLEHRQPLKSRDVVFHDKIFPYGSELLTKPGPIMVELPWPSLGERPPPPRPSTPDLPLLNIPLEPRFDRRLQASIHAPKIAMPSPDLNHDTPTTPRSIPDTVGNPISPNTIILPPLPPLTSCPDPASVAPAPSGPVSAPSAPGAAPKPFSPPRRKSGRDRKAPDRYGQWSKTAKVTDDVDTPKTWNQLLKSPNKSKWLKAADSEYASLLGMNTWKLVPRPQKRKIIKSKWVFKIKRRPDRSIQKLKARLVAMGYSQIRGTDYDEVFSPTLRLETLRLILTLLASKSWTGRQVDFTTAFLNGRLDHTVYMEQPPGFEDPSHPDWVCQLDRSLYGLKQSPRQWNHELHTALIDLGLTNSAYDPTLYFQLKGGKLIGALTTHVDDLAIVGEPSFVGSLISSLGQRFKIGADEDLHHFLSLKITRNVDDRTVFINQSHYIDEIGERFLHGDYLNVATPSDVNFKTLRKRLSSDPASSGPYNQLIGSLLWVSQCSRPDVAFVVNKLSQYLRDPSEAHWQAARRVLNYLLSTKDLRLRLGGDISLSGYSDSDWAEDRDDRRSTSGYAYKVGHGVISWKSRKQATVSLSSTEAEYKAISDSCKEGIWLRRILSELGLRSSEAIPLHVDNEGAEALAKNPEHHARTKHIHARYHFARECQQDGKISLKHVSTKDMLADMLTKPLNRVLLEKHRRDFGIVPPP
jgi:transposase InsO family protein